MPIQNGHHMITKSEALSIIGAKRNLSAADCETLWSVAVDGELREVEFPSDITADERLSVESAIQDFRDIISGKLKAQDFIAIEINDERVDEFIEGMRPFLHKNVSVSPTGITFNGDVSVDDLLSMTASLYTAHRKIDKVRSMLYWSLGDVCLKLKQQLGSIDDAILAVTNHYRVSAHSLRNACSVAEAVPSEMRVDGLSYRHYMPLLKYIPAMEYWQILHIVKAIKHGRMQRHRLGNGTMLSIRYPLGEKSIRSLCKATLGISEPTARRSLDRYLITAQDKVFMSRDIPLWAIDVPGFVVIDLQSGHRLGTEGGEVEPFDPSLMYSALLNQEFDAPAST